MVYCDAADVQKRIQTTVFSANTRPSLTDVTGFCDEITTEMDQRFSSIGINLPIDPSLTSIIAYLKTVATYGVAAMVFRSMATGLDQAKAYQDLYDGHLESIRMNPKIITGNISRAEAYGPTSTFTEDVDRAFTREKDQW